MRFTVAGIGYVGASTAALLAQKHEVAVVDISEEKLECIRQGKSPVSDEDMERFFAENDLTIRVSEDRFEDYRQSDYIIIATPTNFDEVSSYLDTSAITHVIDDVAESGSEACVVIKSTIPSGFMDAVIEKYPKNDFIFVPEFLREGNAIFDQLNPTRIVIGMDTADKDAKKHAEGFVNAITECVNDASVPVLYMSYGEAEAVKLFSNTYLAMRVAFFNELDTFAEMEGYDAKSIIDGVCLEPRIGDYYNNPSFGYGGYCLPKDSKQLLYDFGKVPENLIKATVEANETRKKYIADTILAKAEALKEDGGSAVVGVYRLIMKNKSGNFRESSVLSIIEYLRKKGVDLVIYEPLLSGCDEYDGIKVDNDLESFKQNSDIIIANRRDAALEDVEDKVYSRDIFMVN